MSNRSWIPFVNNKFDGGFRSNQEQVIEIVKKNNKKVVVINAPCGSGKSLMGMCIGYKKNYPEQTIYSCSSIDLQKQLHSDFMEAKVLSGRSNYDCNLYEGYKASDCSGKCIEYLSKQITCNYEKEKSDAIKSKYTILNTSYYLHEINYVGRFKGRNTVVIDEADSLEKTMINFVSLTIDQRILNKYRLGIPEYVTKYKSWKVWIEITADRLLGLMNTIKENPEELEEVKSLHNKLICLSKDLDETWLFEHKDKFVFRPLWLTRNLTDLYLFNHASQFVLMSATVPPKAIVSKLFGLSSNEIDYIETDCPFPIQNRQIIYNPIKRLKYGEDEQDIYREIERIIQTHKYQKGIIHSVSYDRMNKIAQIDPKRMITHNSYNKNDQLKKFYQSTNGIFVSPSSERGLDLVGDLGRFAIWPKIPFPSLGDKVISKRAYSKPFGDYWYKSITAQSIVQGCGRIVRNEFDHGINYILDSAFESIVEFCPKYFRDAIVYKF